MFFFFSFHFMCMFDKCSRLFRIKRYECNSRRISAKKLKIRYFILVIISTFDKIAEGKTVFLINFCSRPKCIICCCCFFSVYYTAILCYTIFFYEVFSIVKRGTRVSFQIRFVFRTGNVCENINVLFDFI